ncbi:Lipase 2 [Verticillium dahliae VDG2]|nr:Lipase 2 [Verticillium dahliae VDG2]
MAVLAIPSIGWQPQPTSHSDRWPLNKTLPILKLPPELRHIIWEFALPAPRIYEVLDGPEAKQKTPAVDGLFFANVRYEPPPILAAGRLPRDQGLYLAPRDIILLEPYLLVKRLLRTLQFLIQVPLVRNNLTCLALGTSYGMNTRLTHPVLGKEVLETNIGVLLSRLSKLPKLKRLLFIVHQEFQFEWDLSTAEPQLPPLFLLRSIPPGSHDAHRGFRFKPAYDLHSNNYFLHRPVPEFTVLRNEDWPSDDEWRRFNHRFQRAANASLETKHPGKATIRREALPAVEGACLLWRYQSQHSRAHDDSILEHRWRVT